MVTAANLLVCALTWWLCLYYQAWATPQAFLVVRPRWRGAGVASCWSVPLLLLVGLDDKIGGSYLVSCWFIALAACRAFCKVLLRQGSAVLLSLDANIVLSLLLIGTAFLPLLTDYAVAEFMGLDYSSLVLGVYISPAVWTHLALYCLSFLGAWLYKLCFILCRMLRFRCLKRRALGTQRQTSCNMNRVLIIHASVGAGHKRAAEAVKDALALTHKDCEVTVMDIVDMGGSLFHLIYKKGYLELVNRTWGAYLVGYLFDAGNKAPPGFVKRILEEAILLEFFEYLYQKEFDIIIHTHFLALEFISMLRREGLYTTPQVVTITDFDTHAWWALDHVEHYFVARRDGLLGLTFHGIPEEQISISGIPIVPAFESCPCYADCLRQVGVEGIRPVVLLVSFGPKVTEAYSFLLRAQVPLEIVVITGRQADVRSKLEQVQVPKHHSVKLEGFTRIMERYLRVADIVISKPGGLTSSECLASGCAMIVVSPYPGQEQRNSDFLLEAGVATRCQDLHLLPHKVDELASQPARLTEMQRRATQLARPKASFLVAKACQQIVQHGSLESIVRPGIVDAVPAAPLTPKAERLLQQYIDSPLKPACKGWAHDAHNDMIMNL